MAEYEKKYTKLSRYAETILAFENDKCKQFDKGLRKEIHTAVTSIPSGLNSQ